MERKYLLASLRIISVTFMNVMHGCCEVKALHSV